MQSLSLPTLYPLVHLVVSIPYVLLESLAFTLRKYFLPSYLCHLDSRAIHSINFHCFLPSLHIGWHSSLPPVICSLLIFYFPPNVNNAAVVALLIGNSGLFIESNSSEMNFWGKWVRSLTSIYDMYCRDCYPFIISFTKGNLHDLLYNTIRLTAHTHTLISGE